MRHEESVVRVICLGPGKERIQKVIERHGDESSTLEDRLAGDDHRLDGANFVVSYGYSHIVPAALAQRFRNRAINLHISLLPWNRGSDPNLWSFLEDSPKGVTIHYLDEGIDTGDILAQRALEFLPDETLRSTYDKACAAVEDLFEEHWPTIRSGELKSVRQPAGGSFHRYSERKAFEHLLAAGWDTPVSAITGRALVRQA